MEGSNDCFIGDKNRISEEDFIKLAMAVQDENTEFKRYLDQLQNKISSDIAEFVFSSEDPHERIVSLQKTLNDLDNVCEMDRTVLELK